MKRDEKDRTSRDISKYFVRYKLKAAQEQKLHSKAEVVRISLSETEILPEAAVEEAIPQPTQAPAKEARPYPNPTFAASEATLEQPESVFNSDSKSYPKL